MTLTADEFIRRFLLHVPPAGFQHIRHYGFLANRYRETKLARCRQLLQLPSPIVEPAAPLADYRDQYQKLTGQSLRDCPRCGTGHMLVIDTFPVRARARTTTGHLVMFRRYPSPCLPSSPCVSDGPGSSACHLRRAELPRVLQRPSVPQTAHQTTTPRPFIRRDATGASPTRLAPILIHPPLLIQFP